MRHTISRIASKLMLPIIALLIPMANASELGLRTKHLPLYIQAATGADGDDLHKKPTPVSLLSYYAEPEATIGFLNSPYIPHHDTSWKKATDANLISLCGVKISYKQIENKEDPRVFAMEVQIDTSAFKKPEDIKMTDAEVMELIQKSVALNFPKSKIVTIK